MVNMSPKTRSTPAPACAVKATVSYWTRSSRARAGAKPTPPKTIGTTMPSGRRPAAAEAITGKQFSWRRAPAWVVTMPAQTEAPK